MWEGKEEGASKKMWAAGANDGRKRSVGKPHTKTLKASQATLGTREKLLRRADFYIEIFFLEV
jgi:hypothetical protein